MAFLHEELVGDLMREKYDRGLLSLFETIEERSTLLITSGTLALSLAQAKITATPLSLTSYIDDISETLATSRLWRRFRIWTGRWRLLRKEARKG